MKTKKITAVISIFSASILMLASCDDFLDKMPDNRIELSTPGQISELLVNAYSAGNYAVLGELSSDNFIDNNSPNSLGYYYNLAPFERAHNEAFAWEDLVSSTEQDSPSAIWSGCYFAIAVCNHALEAIARFEAEGRASEVSAQKGEALVSRAYHHFILVNVFAQAYKNDDLSKNDPGVPYMTQTENEVSVDYERLSVTAVYDSIEADLLKGIPLIDDNNYAVPKYHFNKRAANAFAARFYLFKREYQKVVDYADAVLESDPSTFLRNWNVDYATYDAFKTGWISAESRNNLLLVPTTSWFNRIFGTRYGCNRDAADGTIYGTGPTWSSYNFSPCYSGQLYISSSEEYGLFFPKCGEFFEYTDKIAGIGYGHVVRAEFTGEETLLCRAEANVFLNNISGAVADLKAFDDSRKIEGYTYTDLTEAVIGDFYTSARPLFVRKLNCELMSPDFVVSPAQEPFIHCILHFRRLETIFDGMRWFDIKRYGIEITHNIGKDRVETLTWNDSRRALQIPQEVIAAGMEPNNRLVLYTAPDIAPLDVSPLKN